MNYSTSTTVPPTWPAKPRRSRFYRVSIHRKNRTPKTRSSSCCSSSVHQPSQPSSKSQKAIKTPGEQFSKTFDTFLEAQAQNPEAKYRVQLTKMRHTGFTNTQKCIAALDETGGEVAKAIDMLLKQGASAG